MRGEILHGVPSHEEGNAVWDGSIASTSSMRLRDSGDADIRRR